MAWGEWLHNGNIQGMECGACVDDLSEKEILEKKFNNNWRNLISLLSNLKLLSKHCQQEDILTSVGTKIASAALTPKSISAIISDINTLVETTTMTTSRKICSEHRCCHKNWHWLYHWPYRCYLLCRCLETDFPVKEVLGSKYFIQYN